MSDLAELLKRDLWHPLLRLKVTRAALGEVSNQLEGRQLGNLAAHDIFVQAVQGWMVELSDYGASFIAVLERVKQKHRGELRRNRWKEIAHDPSQVAQIGPGKRRSTEELKRELSIPATSQWRAEYKRLWDQYFPQAAGGQKGEPTHADLDALKERIREVGKPIKEHRDTVAAHRNDDRKLSATCEQVDTVYQELEGILGDLYYLATLDCLSFDPPADWKWKQAADALAASIRQV